MKETSPPVPAEPVHIPEEDVLDPDLPIIDAHHHVFDRSRGNPTSPNKEFDGQTYLFPDLLKDIDSGHNIRASVYAECGSMYRVDGPRHLAAVGEIEFVNGIAAISASGLFGQSRLCAGIVGNADLRMGDAVEEVLVAFIRAGGGRFCGIRRSALWDADPAVSGGTGIPGLLLDPVFRSGFRRLVEFDIAFDAWLAHPQIPELVDLARAFPNARIILTHLGAPLAVGSYAVRRQEAFADWRRHMASLATCANVFVKLGGFGVKSMAMVDMNSGPATSSAALAERWRMYVETCVDLFSPGRCMFESNFPNDRRHFSYRLLWNAYKRLAAGYSAQEKRDLFAGTATRAYRLVLPTPI